MTTLTIPEFDRRAAEARQFAETEPVVITDRGAPAYVLMRHDAYQRLAALRHSLRDLLAHPASDDIEFDPPRLGDEIVSPPLP